MNRVLYTLGLIVLVGCTAPQTDSPFDAATDGGSAPDSPEPSTGETMGSGDGGSGDAGPGSTSSSTSGTSAADDDGDGSTGDDPTAGPDLGPGAHAYFDLLSARSDAQYSASWRTLDEIQADTANWGVGPSPPTYDETMDAARNEVSGASVDGRDQLVPEFDRIDTGTVMFYWETRWDGSIPEQMEAFGIDTHKSFVLRQEGPGEKRMLEIRNRYSLADAPDISTVDFRGYGGGWAFEGESAPLDGQIAQFVVAPDAWTRYWVYCDFEGRQVEVWLSDETRPPIKLLSKMFTDMSAGTTALKFQFNSSQSRSGGDPVDVWNRNFVILRDLEDAAEDIVDLSVP